MTDSLRLAAQLSQITDAVYAGLKNEQVSQILVDEVRRILDSSVASLWACDEVQECLHLVATTGDHAQLLPSTLPLDSELAVVVPSSRQVVIVGPESGSDDSIGWSEWGFTHVLGVPVITGEIFVGALIVASREKAFSEADIAIAKLVGGLASGFWAGEYFQGRIHRLTRELDMERERLSRLQAVIRQMLSELDIRANLSAVTNALKAEGWRYATLILFDEEGQRKIVGDESLPDDHVPGESCGISRDLWERYLRGELDDYRHGGVYFVPDGDPGSEAWKLGDAVFAPLQVGQGEVIGVICVGDPVSKKRPTWADLRPLDILAGQSAYIVENARLLETVSRSAEKLAEQIEDLSMMHRADRELSSHLNLDRVMRLTMDWALRRTGADTGLLMLMTDDHTGLVPYTIMGHVDREMFPYSAENPLPITAGIMGRAVRTGKTQFVRDVMADKDYVPFFPGVRTHLTVPLLMRGEVLGVIALASTRNQAFDEDAVGFLERLARRAALALDNARLYRQAEQMANDMAVLYNASRTITSTLERDKILLHIAQAMAGALECSSAVIFDYHDDRQEVQILAVYRDMHATDAKEVLPPLKHTIPLVTYPAFQTVVEQHHPLVLRANDPSISRLDRARLIEDRIYGMVLVPLVAQGELMGVAAVIEGRRDRAFTPNDVYKAEALASQASVALRQAMLFDEVRELEHLKSEMIRMASHDLRNPLNTIMGYIDLLEMSLGEGELPPDQMQYFENLRKATRLMHVLLEDLLTVERIESEREADWQPFDFAGLAAEVVAEQRPSVELKQQALLFEQSSEPLLVFGSVTQLRQAVANLVDNAIKYTPEHGQIKVSLTTDLGKLRFVVKDDGYGISPERQARLFERFYRAREPGTEHIGGTGLGLSLVKTVVERHGGQTWFTSAPGKGSTFGFWLPLHAQ